MIEITQEQADKFTDGIMFEDLNGQPFVFKDGFVAIIRPAKPVVEEEAPAE